MKDIRWDKLKLEIWFAHTHSIHYGQAFKFVLTIVFWERGLVRAGVAVVVLVAYKATYTLH